MGAGNICVRAETVCGAKKPVKSFGAVQDHSSWRKMVGFGIG
jgi:hypothetical protein